MKDGERRCEKLLRGLDPIELARVAVTGIRDFEEGVLNDQVTDHENEARAVGRRAVAFKGADRERYVRTMAVASEAALTARLTVPGITALAVAHTAAVQGGAGWSMLSECVGLLEQVRSTLRGLESPEEASGAAPVEGALSPELAVALATVDGTLAAVREQAEAQATALLELGAAAEREAGALAAIFNDARKRAVDAVGVDPVPPSLVELFTLAGIGTATGGKGGAGP